MSNSRSMTPERYAQVQEVYARVRRLGREEQAAALAEYCADDAELRREVASLLEHSASTLSLEGGPEVLAQAAAGVLDDWEKTNAPPPQMVGPYRILSVLGEGGMGVVYLAEQTVPVRRRVALKLIKLGMDTREVVARFQSERQALALMNHPNVASVLDAGATPEGRPYFVMELVPGQPVTTYCDAHHLSVRQRLELFIPICNAVHHAHQKGVIHRDLKPSNILVADHDGEPAPKVIDFGVAKAVSQQLSTHTLQTQQGRLLGTPEYMAPEQAVSGGIDVDTRVDIYSLGVLLYQLLTGRLPLAADDMRGAGYEQLIRAIQEKTPLRPSTRVGERGEESLSAARSRGAEPRTLERELRGDLDWIVMKALDKERGRRYESAAALAQDIERYLRSEPVSARQPSAMYRLSKLVQRHQAGFAAAALVAAALVIGIIGTSIGLYRARAAEALARAERDEADMFRRRESEARGAAEKARSQADEQAEALRRAMYTQQIALAQNAYRSDSVLRMKELLAGTQPQRRGWEWNYLNWLADRSELTLKGHNEAVRCVAATRDGRYIITGGWDTQIIIWDARSGAEVRRLTGHQHSVHALALHPDGKWLFSSSYDHTVRAWDIDTGRELAVYYGPGNEVWGLAISPDGTRVAAGSADHTLWLWDAETRRPVWHHAHHTDRVTDLAFTLDGKRIISTSSDSTLRVTDAFSGRELDVWRGHTWRVNCVAISPDGSLVASGDDDKVVRIRASGTGQEIAVLRGHGAGIISLDFSPDGRQLVTGSWDKKIKIWDVGTAQEVLTLPGHGDIVWAVRYAPDGTRVISGSNDWTAKVWSLGAGGETTKLAGHHLAVLGLAWSPSSRLLASGGYDGTVRIWDAATGSELHTLRAHRAAVASIAFSRDGARLMSFDPMGMLAVCAPQTGELLSLRNVCPRRGAGGGLNGDGSRLGTYTADGAPCLIDTESGKMLLRLPRLTVVRGAMSNDGALAAVSDPESNITVCDAKTGRVVWTARGHHYPIRCLAFSADGKLLASGGEDRALKLWDAHSGTLLHEMMGHELAVGCVAFAPDGRRIATGGDDRAVKLWDPDTGQDVLTLRGHEQEINAVAFSPDGRVLASAAIDWTIRLWECGPPAEGFGSRPVVLEAQQLVHQMRKFATFSGDLAERIAADPKLTEAVRGEALRLVGVEGDDVKDLIDRAWALLDEPDEERARTSLRLAEAARRQSPKDPSARDAVGVAQCRMGAWAEGEATLAATIEGASCGPINLAYRAMAAEHLGRSGDAAALLRRARMAMISPEHFFLARDRAAVYDAAMLIEGGNGRQ